MVFFTYNLIANTLVLYLLFHIVTEFTIINLDFKYIFCSVLYDFVICKIMFGLQKHKNADIINSVWLVPILPMQDNHSCNMFYNT